MKRCTLWAVICNYITMHGHMNTELNRNVYVVTDLLILYSFIHFPKKKPFKMEIFIQ